MFAYYLDFKYKKCIMSKSTEFMGHLRSIMMIFRLKGFQEILSKNANEMTIFICLIMLNILPLTIALISGATMLNSNVHVVDKII